MVVVYTMYPDIYIHIIVHMMYCNIQALTTPKKSDGQPAVKNQVAPMIQVAPLWRELL